MTKEKSAWASLRIHQVPVGHETAKTVVQYNRGK
mgnify:FL=1